MKQIKLDTFDVDTLWKLKLKLLVRILMSCSMFNLVLRWVRGQIRLVFIFYKADDLQ